MCWWVALWWRILLSTAACSLMSVKPMRGIWKQFLHWLLICWCALAHLKTHGRCLLLSCLASYSFFSEVMLFIMLFRGVIITGYLRWPCYALLTNCDLDGIRCNILLNHWMNFFELIQIMKRHLLIFHVLSFELLAMLTNKVGFDTALNHFFGWMCFMVPPVRIELPSCTNRII